MNTRKLRLILATTAAGALSIAGTQALAQTAPAGGPTVAAGEQQVALLERAGAPLERSIALHRQEKRLAEARRAYVRALERVRDAGLEPRATVDRERASRDALRDAARKLRRQLREARAAASAEPGAPGQTVSTAAEGAATGSVAGGTLEAIAACESGGDPTAVSPGGDFRGKYQFMPSTWAAVGGSGDPAAAPEAEQDMRAAMLYEQAGPGQWPVCAG